MNQDVKQNINKFTLKISPDTLDKDFNRVTILENLKQIRSVYIIAMIMCMATIIYDYKILDTLAILMIKIRFLGVMPPLIIALFTTYLKNYTKYSTFISSSMILVTGCSVTIMAAVSGKYEYFTSAYSGLFIVMFFLFSFIRIHFIYTFFIGLSLSISYLIVENLIIHPSENVQLVHTFSLISATFIGTLIAYSVEYQSKREYLLKKLLSESLVTDTLTNLHNRRYFEQVLVEDISNFIQKTELTEDKRNNENNTESSKYGILMIDIDKFKNINDTFGHHSGDLVLIQLATLLRNNVRTSDDVLRLGGEEFLIVLKQTSEEYITGFIRKIGSAISNYNFIIENDITVNCTVSIGLVVVPFIKTNNIGKLIQYADKALYHSKDMGRNRGYRLYTKNDEVYFEEMFWDK